MVTILPFEADNVVGLRIEGKLSRDDFAEVVAAIDAIEPPETKVHLYVEVHTFGGISLEAFLKDIRYSLGNWRRFERKVIVTNKSWLHKIGAAADKVFPSVEVKVFPLEEREQARQYLAS